MSRMNIWKTGVTETMDLEDQQLVTFSNGIYVIAGSVLLLAEIIMGGLGTIVKNPSLSSLSPFFLVTLAAICLLINKLHQFLVSRIIFIIFLTFIVSVLPTISRGPGASSYYFHPFYLILSSPMIHLLFSRAKDKYIRFGLLLFSGLFVMFSIDFLIYFSTATTPPPPFRSFINARIIFVSLWLILNLLMAYILRTNRNFYHSLRQQKELIALQGKLLLSQNEELSAANQKLTGLNDQIHQLNEALEKRVEERTQELTERNKVLSEYAFMNAHLLRSPVSRIKGLINLFRITDDDSEKKIVEESLLHSAEELDQVVHSISKKLNEVK